MMEQSLRMVSRNGPKQFYSPIGAASLRTHPTTADSMIRRTQFDRSIMSNRRTRGSKLWMLRRFDTQFLLDTNAQNESIMDRPY
jgi:hypothetical protein